MSTGTQLRRLLAFFLTLGILLGGLPAAAWAAEPTEPVEYVNTPGGGQAMLPARITPFSTVMRLNGLKDGMS